MPLLDIINECDCFAETKLGHRQDRKRHPQNEFLEPKSEPKTSSPGEPILGSHFFLSLGISTFAPQASPKRARYVRPFWSRVLVPVSPFEGKPWSWFLREEARLGLVCHHAMLPTESSICGPTSWPVLRLGSTLLCGNHNTSLSVMDTKSSDRQKQAPDQEATCDMPSRHEPLYEQPTKIILLQMQRQKQEKDSLWQNPNSLWCLLLAGKKKYSRALLHLRIAASLFACTPKAASAWLSTEETWPVPLGHGGVK